MDIDIERAKELIIQREKIDDELREIFGGERKRSQECSVCKKAGRDGTGHTARNCPHKSE